MAEGSKFSVASQLVHYVFQVPRYFHGNRGTLE